MLGMEAYTNIGECLTLSLVDSHTKECEIPVLEEISLIRG